ncbi:hypothetical protein ACFSL6_17530 [Paenibacillus thailandensis]|uniref:Uncharacterized protein n=1 Tax=Paenibacillus thailandensis TaxID=393250 RepID=A0ABW5R2H5_9BACL
MDHIQLLRNICMYYLQLEERAAADCMPAIGAHAYKQYCRYRMKLNRLVVLHGGR